MNINIQGCDLVFLSTVIFVSGFILSLLFIFSYKKMNLTDKNYSGIGVPYAGGTIFLFTFVISYLSYYYSKNISYFKCFVFIFSISAVFILGFIDDLYGNNKIFHNSKRLKKLVNHSLWGILNTLLNIIIIFYIFFIFNDTFWFLEGMITLLFTYIYRLINTNPGRCLKIHYFLLLLLNLANLQWTNELLTISLILVTTYYFFDAFSFSLLGKSGSNILGFTAGLIYSEAFSTRTFYLIVSIVFLLILYIVLSRNQLPKVLVNSNLFIFLDKLLTDRGDAKVSYNPEHNQGPV